MRPQTASLSFGILVGVVGATIQGPTADLGSVKYMGSSNALLGINSFLGVRYAEPPVDDLRWRAPVPINSSNTTTAYSYTTNATSYGLQCVQGTPAYHPQTFNNSLASEDCLFLDIVAPSKPASESLPVVINMHGGAYTLGNSTSEDGSQLVSYSNGAIIYVAIQYRLGAYGFLAGSEVQADGVLNAGLLDQRAAIEWVRDNIHAFGGDPKQISIVGGSAGGGSVIYQLLRGGGESNPPFRSAMPQFAGFAPHRSPASQDAIYGKLLGAAKCTSLACLRALPYEELANATQQSYSDAYDAGLYGYGDFAYTPVVDGSFLVDFPSRSLAAGNFTKVPIFNTVDQFEGFGFTNGSVTTEDEVNRDISHLWPDATPQFVSDLLALYPPSAYGPAFKAANNLYQSSQYPLVEALFLAQDFNLSSNNPPLFQNAAIWGDAVIHCVSRNLAAAAFNSIPTKVPIWKLRFNAGYYAHAAVNRYFLGVEGPKEFVFNGTLADITKDWYLSFVINQDPNMELPTRNGSSRPWWPQYGAMNDVLLVNETRFATIADPDAADTCDFFAANADVIRS
ncbi:uncharacterized protein RCC_03852 [Ramularia collo-cygni]|uniref:Carboxylic ester hydrolase n=1 Tax=Ramularia collo-cygni TaxID=112498 RepID=A0A2D3V663_9PEZI|nr:uncharacterized protein RCC_03852 [Ramularia collo-cygni]CZT18014.1 uncharacterized protein RCC_03852 [Ramularia collo-cygni]